MQRMGARFAQETSTSKPQGIRLGASWIASAPPSVQSKFLESLEGEELKALPFLFEFWALEHQLPPEGDWRTWLVMGGRGAGKTRAGAEWVRSLVEGAGPGDPGKARRIGLVGETFDQAREVMVFGESGILAVCPPDRRPEWIAGRKMLVWPNGATAQVLSAHDPDALRGLQFDGLWADRVGLRRCR
jgi:phage terminase large subunit-like protein